MTLRWRILHSRAPFVLIVSDDKSPAFEQECASSKEVIDVLTNLIREHSSRENAECFERAYDGSPVWRE